MNVLITGGSGLIGRELVESLRSKGYDVGVLTRSKKNLQDVREFLWDIETMVIDEDSLQWADHIVHLAGESVGQRWTGPTKKRIIDSRVDSTNLLATKIAEGRFDIKSFVAASAVGIYGRDTGDEIMTEKSPKGPGFLADVVEQWEASIGEVDPFVDKLVKLRLGIVLTSENGALGKMVTPIRLGFGSPLGSGKQWVSWIDVKDLSTMIIFCIENQLSGLYNAVAPNPVTNKQMTQEIAVQVNRKLFLPNVPSFVLKILLGEMSSMVLGGNNVSSIAIQQEGFKFEYDTINKSLAKLIGPANN